ncbi:DEAD-domain-containing protein [Acaromyces ingoldii]|uniref:ATP-dependent RNA helicase n=1 Tax=Acaromyces ingoldii TaxID=215250 RepID=A0A316YPN6_9BASI|nr:DEAD-domain-containing protein [Acaromyces ingoldii]PWN90618.1 DEAD-domain-containing protein [Acaromyces ingoldii]
MEGDDRREKGHLSDRRFDSLGSVLDPRLLSSIPFEFMSVVQAATLEHSLSGVDVLAQAKTGTGKTLAFLLPCVQRISTMLPLVSRSPSDISVLILSPTRELALQIEKEAVVLLRGFQGAIGVQHCVGGTNMETEKRALRSSRADILVATPGRLIDHLQNSGLAPQLRNVRALVLDEADRMLDMGFRRELQTILAALPSRQERPRQSLLFSATIPQGIRDVADLDENHVFVNTLRPEEQNTHQHVPQDFIIVPHTQTFAATLCILLESLSQDPKTTKPILFFSTARSTAIFFVLLETLQKQLSGVHSANLQRLSPAWQALQTVPVFELHSRKSQSQRVRATQAFTKSQTAILCSSDVTARGVDFPGVTSVIQVGLPSSGEQYIHRLGRTARAGAAGSGVLILTPYERFFLRKKEVAGLPLRERKLVFTEDDLLPEADSAIRKALMTVSDKEKSQAYQAALGYYKSSLKDLGWSPAQLVDEMNDWARQALLFQEGASGPAPPLLAKTVGKMGLKGTPGLNVVKQLPSWADDGAGDSPNDRGDVYQHLSTVRQRGSPYGRGAKVVANGRGGGAGRGARDSVVRATQSSS